MPQESEKPARRARADGDGRRKKRKRDPNAPKPGLSPFMLFSQEARAKIKADNPTATFGDIGRILGEKWRGMSDADKAPFVKKSELDKERYLSQKSTYESKAGQAR